MGAEGIGQGGQTDRNGGKSGGDHRLHKERARAAVQRATLFPRDRDPQHDEAHRPGRDVHNDQPFEKGVGRQHHMTPPILR